MGQYLIASHGKLASGLQSSIKILTGMDQQLQVVDAYLDESDFTPQITAFIDQLGDKPGVIFTDIIGGSVNQKVMTKVTQRPNISVISGVNLPIVMSVLLNTKPITKDLLNELVAESQVQLVSGEQDSDDEDAF